MSHSHNDSRPPAAVTVLRGNKTASETPTAHRPSATADSSTTSTRSALPSSSCTARRPTPATSVKLPITTWWRARPRNSKYRYGG